MNTDHILQIYDHASSLENFLMKHCLKLRQCSLLIALLLSLIITVMDSIRFPSDTFEIILVSRLVLVIIPLAFLNYFFWLKPPSSVLKHVNLILFTYIGAGVNHSIVHYFAVLNGVDFSEVGLILIIMLGCLLTAIPIFKASIASVFILVVYAFVHALFDFGISFLVFSVIVLSVIAFLFLLINSLCQRVLIENYYLIKRLHEDSITDGLTTLFNRRFFNDQFSRLIQLSDRNNCNLALILIDVDHFKKINDKFGHIAGDLVLQNIATFIKNEANRPFDYCFRIGGDEMAIILFDTSPEKVGDICNKLIALNNIVTHSPDQEKIAVPVTLSIGAVLKETQNSSTCRSLLEATDHCLYRSKNKGRNQFHINII